MIAAMSVDYVMASMLIAVVAVGIVFTMKQNYIAVVLCVCGAILCIWRLLRSSKNAAESNKKISDDHKTSTPNSVSQSLNKNETNVKDTVESKQNKVKKSSSISNSESRSKTKLSREEVWGLPNLRCRDDSGRVIKINSEEPIDINNSFLEGKILFMLRTEGELEKYNRYREHFKTVKRKFEIQVQVRFKELPKGVVMMGGELSEKLVLGIVTRTLLSMIMKFGSKLINNMNFGFGEDATPDGNYENPFICFPMYRAMDRVVITPEGEPVPNLGRELPEDDKTRSARRSGKSPDIVYEIGPTYSFSFHSMYIDFTHWAVCNVSGYKDIGLETFLGKLAAHIVVYDFDKNASNGRHTTKAKKYITDFELMHESMMPETGPDSIDGFDRVDENEQQMGTTNSMDDSSSDRGNNDNGAESAGDGQQGGDLISTKKRSSTIVADSVLFDDTGPPIKSGLVVPFVALPLAWEVNGGNVTTKSSSTNKHTIVTETLDDDVYGVRDTGNTSSGLLSTYYMGIGEHDGQAVRWRIPYGHNMRLIKVNSVGEDSDTNGPVNSTAGEDIMSGDTVMIQSVTSSFYLGAYRGFFLTWSQSQPPDTKGHFVVSVIDATTGISRDKNGGNHSIAAALRLGMPFRLRSARWPSYEVGIESADASRVKSSSDHLTGDGARYMDCLVLYEYATNCPLLASKSAYIKAKKRSSARSSASKHLGGGDQHKSAFPLYLCGITYPRKPLSLLISDPEEVASVSALSTSAANGLKFVVKTTAAPGTPSNRQNLELFEREAHLQTIALLDSLANQQVNPITTPSNSTKNVNSVIPPSHSSSESHVSMNTNKIDLSIIGWVDIIHRTTCAYEIAYIMKVSVALATSDGSAYLNKWAIIRSGQEIDSMLCLLETFEKRCKESDQGALAYGGNNANVTNLNVVIPKQHEPMTSQVQKLLSYRLQRCMSNILVRNSIEFQKIISEFILKPNIYDSWFLNGGVMQLYPDSLHSSTFLPVHENAHGSLKTCSVARALWDGEWREEVAVLTYDALYFYLPVPVSMNTTVAGNSKYCSKRIAVHDIVGISHVYNEESPLPGFQILRIETIGRVHYVAFHDAEAKESLMIELSQQINDVSYQPQPAVAPSKATKDSGGNLDMDRFVLRSRQWTPSSRHILNARVFAFDTSMMQRNVEVMQEEAEKGSHSSAPSTPLQQLQYAQAQALTPFSPNTPVLMPLTPQNSICDLSIRLLKRIQSINLSIALSAKTRVTSPSLASPTHDESLFNMGPLDFGCAHESSRNLLNCFLMEICELKAVKLQDVDFRSTDTLCFFVNIYHTLLLHARLILGRPTKHVS